MIDPERGSRHPLPMRTVRDLPDASGLAIGRVTKGVATAIGKSLTVERDAALPESLASLVERLQAGPLGQQNLKSRVA